jgi:hypothetical protein
MSGCPGGLFGAIMVRVITRRIRTPAEHWFGYLRVLEARSSDTSIDRLRVLATDNIRPVRVWTARNPNTPADALSALAQDEDLTVSWNALLHPRTAPQALQILADQEAATAPPGWFIVRGLVVHHPNTNASPRRELLAAGACRICPADACPGFHPYRRLQPS